MSCCATEGMFLINSCQELAVWVYLQINKALRWFVKILPRTVTAIGQCNLNHNLSH